MTPGESWTLVVCLLGLVGASYTFGWSIGFAVGYVRGLSRRR